MQSFILPLLWAIYAISGASAAFGVTTVSGGYRVDTNGGLVFDVRGYDIAIYLVFKPLLKILYSLLHSFSTYFWAVPSFLTTSQHPHPLN
jgi:hypothetical protein